MQQSSKLQLNTLASLFASCALLSACGGGSGSGSNETEASTFSALISAQPAGVVASTASTASDATASTQAASSSTDSTSLLTMKIASTSGTTTAAPSPAPTAAPTPAPAVLYTSVAGPTKTSSAASASVQANPSGTSATTTSVSAATLWTVTESTPSPDVSGTLFTASSVASLVLPSANIVLDAARVPKEDWATAKTKYNTSSGWKSWVDGRKTLVDTWISKTRERPDLVGGYMSDYIDPATNLPLTWTPESPEPPDGTTTKETLFKRGWVFYLRGYNIQRIVDAVGVYKATGNTKYAEWAASQLDFYATNYNLWPLRTNLGRARMFQQGLDEATSSFDLLDAARLLGDYATSTRTEKWRIGLFVPMLENLKIQAAPLSNIGLWHGAAIAAIGMRYRDAAAVDWALNGSIGIRATLKASVTRDNLWIEGSFGYNSYVINALYRVVLNSFIEGQSSLLLPERTALQNLLLGPLDYTFDDGMLPTPSDASALKAIDVATHFAVYRVLPTWWGVQKAGATQSWSILIDPPVATSSAAPTLPKPTTRNFPANRMAVLRSGQWQAFVHYGQLTINHAQEEALSFEVYNGSTKISTDSGTVGSYSSSYHNDYFRKGPANTVPLVDGTGQAKWAPGVVDSFVAEENRITVTQANYAYDVTASRGYRVTSTGFTELTTLKSAAGTSRRMGEVFHTGCTVAPLSGLTATSGLTPPSNASTAYWKGMTPYRASGTWSVVLTCAGGAQYTYSVNGPANQTVFIGTGPTTPMPAERAVLYYETTAATAKYEVQITKR